MAHRSARRSFILLLVTMALVAPGAPLPELVRTTWPVAYAAAAKSGSWTVQSSGTRQPLFAVSCFDVQRCKAVGAAGTLLYTRNGGRTWRPQFNPLTGTPTILYRIACLGRSTCYVIGRPNLIMVTHDGGVRWSVHELALPGMGGELTDPACVESQVYDLRGRLALCRLGLLDLACLSVSTCYVVATIKVQAQIGDLGPAVFLTTDGGATWTSSTIPNTAPCGGDCGPAGTRVPYPLEWISCGPGSLCRAGGSIFIGSHEGYAWFTIKSPRPGAPWVPLETNLTASFGPVPDAAVCLTAATCYGVWTTSPFQPGNAIWRSTDGGWSWQGMSSGSARLRNAIACSGGGTCYSVGNQGTITATTNGGLFHAQRSGTSHDLYGVTCLDTQACFAVGNKGTIVARG